jgi:hypothetical protein
MPYLLSKTIPKLPKGGGSEEDSLLRGPFSTWQRNSLLKGREGVCFKAMWTCPRERADFLLDLKGQPSYLVRGLGWNNGRGHFRKQTQV